MNVTKTDIIQLFEEREKQLKERINNTKNQKLLYDKTDEIRLYECRYLKEILSLAWNIIHQKKRKTK